MCADFLKCINGRMRIRLLAFVACFACDGTAWGTSPPLATDDPETPGKGGWEINITSSLETGRDEASMEVPLFDINYGLHENDQLKIEFAVQSIDASDDENHWGIGDLAIGYKYRFMEEDEYGWMASIYPQFSTPTGNDELALGSGNTELLIPIEWGKHFCDGRYFLDFEVGYNLVFPDHSDNGWKLGVAGEWKATDRLELLGEVGAELTRDSIDSDDVFFNVGCEYIVTEAVAFLFSAGRSFGDRRDGAPDFTCLVGLEFTIGGTPEAAD